MESFADTLDFNTVPTDALKVRTQQEMGVVSVTTEFRAVIAAQRTRADDGNFHV
jgi:hypothetical protein